MQVPYRWRINTIIKNIDYLLCEVKWFIQRGKRGYSDRDVWGIDYYLAEIMPKMLKQLKETAHGYPGYEEASTPEEWSNLLNDMILGFESAKRVLEDEYIDEVQPGWFDREGRNLLSTDSGITKESLNEVRKMSKQDRDLFEEKMKIFTKWFFALWD